MQKPVAVSGDGFLARRKGFACILFSLAGDGKTKYQCRPVCALDDERPTGAFDSYSNPNGEYKKRAARMGNPLFGTP